MNQANAHPRRIVVVGAGIAGLACAHRLKTLRNEQGLDTEIELLEAGERVGGKLISLRESGFVMEGGADAFLTTKPAAIALCKELGLTERLIPTNAEQSRVFIRSGGALHAMPDGLRLVAPTKLLPFLRSGLVSWPAKLRMAAEAWIPRRRDGSGDAPESMADFVGRRFGQEAVDRLASPLMAGLYMGRPEELGIAETFPQLVALETEHGSLIRGFRAAMLASKRAEPDPDIPDSLFVAPLAGTAELAEALAEQLGPEILNLGAGVHEASEAESGYRIRLNDDHEIEADVLVLALPAPSSAALLETSSPELASALREIPHRSSASVSLGFKRADIGHPLDGFGFVASAAEPGRIRACSWSSTKWQPHRAPESHVLIRAFLGGAGREADVDLSDEALIELALDALRPILDIRGPAVIARAFRWPSGNPQYRPGHLDTVSRIRAACPPGLQLIGASFDGLGVPDCVRQGRHAAEQILGA